MNEPHPCCTSPGARHAKVEGVMKVEGALCPLGTLAR